MKIDWLKGDGAIILSAEETDAFEIIMSSQEHDLVKLVRSAGHDPLTFFEDGNWREVDFRDSDLRGVSFARANMTGVILYEDQFDEVRKTRPRTLDKAKIQRSRDGGKGDDFYFILDTPLDPSIARTEFKAELEKLFGGTRKPFLQADDWRSLVRYLPQLDQPFGHIWALECILDLTKRMPSDDVLDACARGFDLTVALRGAPWSLAVELLHVCSLKDDRSRFAFLESRVA